MKARRVIGGALVALGLTVGIGGTALASGGPPPPNPNQVEYWCPAGGVKYEDVSTPFTVPAPPEGKVWTLLVLKAADEHSTEVVNETFSNPTVGQAYSRTDGKSISHVILCYSSTTTTTGATTTAATTTVPTTPPTTVSDNPTTTTTSTTIATTTTASTVPSTTTTATTLPSTTTTGNVGICCLQGTTTVASTTSTTAAATTAPAVTTVPTTLPATTVATTVPVVTTAPPLGPDLPVTGSSTLPIALGGAALVGVGLACQLPKRRAA